MNYDEYINSEHWQKLRERKFLQVGRQCEACQWDRPPLQCHHLEYRNLIDCDPSDLLVLCKRCHANLHRWLDARRRSPSDYNRDQTLNIILYGCANRSEKRLKKSRRQRRLERKLRNRPKERYGKFAHENRTIDAIKAQIVERAALEERIVSLILCEDAAC